MSWLAQVHAASKWQSQISDTEVTAQKIRSVMFTVILVPDT